MWTFLNPNLYPITKATEEIKNPTNRKKFKHQPSQFIPIDHIMKL